MRWAMRLLGPRRIARALWKGFVSFGLLSALGEHRPEDVVRPHTVYDEPPPGHPERLTGLPLSPFERRLARELAAMTPPRRRPA